MHTRTHDSEFGVSIITSLNRFRIFTMQGRDLSGSGMALFRIFNSHDAGRKISRKLLPTNSFILPDAAFIQRWTANLSEENALPPKLRN